MRLTRCRLRYRGGQMTYSPHCSSHKANLKKYLWNSVNIGRLVLWCSGYHICLTRRRSPVRNRAAPGPFFFGFGLLQSFNHSAADPRLGGCGFSWCSGYHVCFTRTRSPVRSRARTVLLFVEGKRERKNLSLFFSSSHTAPAWSSG